MLAASINVFFSTWIFQGESGEGFWVGWKECVILQERIKLYISDLIKWKVVFREQSGFYSEQRGVSVSPKDQVHAGNHLDITYGQ